MIYEPTDRYHNSPLPLFISDGPIFRQRPASVEADVGALVSLVCDVAGNPTPDIVWIHDPSNRVCILFINSHIDVLFCPPTQLNAFILVTVIN